MVKSLNCAYKNTGVLNTTTSLSADTEGLAMLANDFALLGVAGINDTENLDCAFAVDDVFKGLPSYIDHMGQLEDLDPSVLISGVGAFENNQFVGTSTGAKGEENVVNAKNFLANNLDLKKDGESFDELNGEDIFQKLYLSVNNDTEDNFVGFTTHGHTAVKTALDGHTNTGNTGKKHVGTGEVAVEKKTASTERYYSDGTQPTETEEGSLQTEVAFTVSTDEEVLIDEETKTILSQTIDEQVDLEISVGDTDTVGMDANGKFKGTNNATQGVKFDWDGTACITENRTFSGKSLNIPNNLPLRVCAEVIIKGNMTVQPGAIVEIASGGSIVVESGATVNIDEGIVNIAEGGVITVEGTLNNNFLGIINNSGTINSKGKINNISLINNNADGEFIWDIRFTSQERSGNVGTINQTGGVFNNNSGAIINNTGIIKIQNSTSMTYDEITMNNTGTINNQSGSEIRISSPGRFMGEDKKYLKNYGIINTDYNSIIRIYNKRGLQNYSTINHNGLIIEEGSIIVEDSDDEEDEVGGTDYQGFYYREGILTTTNDENKVRILLDANEGTDGEGRMEREALILQRFVYTINQYLRPLGLKWSPI